MVLLVTVRGPHVVDTRALAVESAIVGDVVPDGGAVHGQVYAGVALDTAARTRCPPLPLAMVRLVSSTLPLRMEKTLTSGRAVVVGVAADGDVAPAAVDDQILGDAQVRGRADGLPADGRGKDDAVTGRVGAGNGLAQTARAAVVDIGHLDGAACTRRSCCGSGSRGR